MNTPLTVSASWSTRHIREVYVGLRQKFFKGGKVDEKYLRFLRPNQPLLLRFAEQAFGTFRHCVIVGSMAAASAAKIGANPDFTRVVGYLHDLGKILDPALYPECVSGIRSRARAISTLGTLQTILDHPRASKVIAAQYGLPAEVCEALSEHHGTIRTRLRIAAGLMAAISEDQLHYPGPLPSTKETMIVMLADSSQAAFGRIRHKKGWPARPTREDIRQVVNRVGKELRGEGQFENSGFDLAEQAEVEEGIIWWLFRFYNDLQLFGTPRSMEPKYDGRLILPGR
jgi:hypothetical protein